MAGEHEIVNLSDNDDDCVLEAVVCNSIWDQKFIYKDVYSSCPLLAKIIEKCLSLENSEGMLRVINKNLLGLYKDADNKFVKSSQFEDLLVKTKISLEIDPFHKFSHIKVLCDTLIKNKYKKRVQLTTLTDKVSGSKRPKLSFNRNKNLKSDIIDLDSIEDPVILDSDSENVESNKDTVEIDDSPIVVDDEKENHACEVNGNCLEESTDKVPHSDSEVEEVQNIEVEETIKRIEEEITTYKEMIEKLDEEEVSDDDANSPYIRSEKFKAQIVSLYEELCKYTGSRPVKKRKIRLQVIEGHSAGPVQRLESFLNKNVCSNGDPPFPDFCDVVKCVIKSNTRDNLGWNKQQVLREASALFTHCGRALQKRRQERELKDLLSRVKTEMWDGDPADEDPELLARLQANKKVALKKEAEILERFSMIQNLPPQSNTIIHNNDNSRDDVDHTHNKPVRENETILHENDIFKSITNSSEYTNKETTQNAQSLNRIVDDDDSDDDSSLCSLHSDNDSSSDENQINKPTENMAESISKTSTIKAISNIDINNPNEDTATISTVNEISHIENNCTEKTTSKPITTGSTVNKLFYIGIDCAMNNGKDNTNGEELKFCKDTVRIESDEVKVKIEPTEDIVQQLNEFGDNYTVSIVDIEDPFLIVEISDSSDEE